MWNPYAGLSDRNKRIFGLISVMTVVVIWSALSGFGLVSVAKLPTPWAVASAFFRLAWDSTSNSSPLLNATMYSGMRVLAATGLVCLIGIPAGILMGASPKLNALFSPLVDPFRSAPVVALLPVLVMWLGIGEGMKISFLFIGSVVYLIPAVRDAILAVPSMYWISARDLGASKWECVKLVLVPLSMPRIADSIIASVSLIWTYINVAEFVNATSGLGQMIQNSRRMSAMDQVFVGIFVIVGLALVTHNCMTALKKRYFNWEIA